MAEDAGQLSSAGRVRDSAAQDAAADQTGCRRRIIGPVVRRIVRAGVRQSPIQVGQARDEAKIISERPLLPRLVHGPQLYAQLRATATTEPFFALKWHMSVLNRHIRAQHIAGYGP